LTDLFIDTNILYHILHKSNKTEEAISLLDENPGDYTIDSVVHNELIYTSTLHYLEHQYNVKGSYSAKKWIKKYGYQENILIAVRELIEKLDIRIVMSMYGERELYDTISSYKLLPGDAIIALTCKHYGINTILTFDEDFRRVPWLKTIP
jgi:predicted nucleic acid-binding protein